MVSQLQFEPILTSSLFVLHMFHGNAKGFIVFLVLEADHNECRFDYVRVDFAWHAYEVQPLTSRSYIDAGTPDAWF